jgi:hypothetical protein
MLRFGVAAVAAFVLAGSGVASAARVRIVVRPATVAAGGLVTVSAASSPCLLGDQVTLISSAYRGHAFGEGAVYGHVRRQGSFSVRARIRSGLRPGSYTVGARCGGGNLGVSALIRVR